MEKQIIAEWYRLYAKRLYGLAYKLLGHKEDSEDVLQEIFAELLSSNTCVDNPKSYLMASVRNRLTNHINRMRGKYKSMGDRDIEIDDDGKVSWFDGRKVQKKDYEEFNAILDVPYNYRLSWYEEEC